VRRLIRFPAIAGGKGKGPRTPGKGKKDARGIHKKVGVHVERVQGGVRVIILEEKGNAIRGKEKRKKG